MGESSLGVLSNERMCYRWTNNVLLSKAAAVVLRCGNLRETTIAEKLVESGTIRPCPRRRPDRMTRRVARQNRTRLDGST